MQQISVNYLPLNVDALPNIIYQHAITFNPERPKKFLLPAFYLMIQNNFPHLINKVAFDGAKSFYAMQKLPDKTFSALEVASPDGTGRNKEFEVSIQFATEIDMRVIKNYIDYEGPTNIQQAIQAFDVVLKSAFNQQGLIRYKSSVFKIPERKIPLADNFELIIGLYQSFVMGERPLLNVHVSHKAFPSKVDNLHDFYMQKCDQNYRKLNELLKSLNLVYTSPFEDGNKKTYKFNEVKGPANKEKFKDDKDNKWKTIEDYYRDKKIKLKNPKAPVIHVGPRDKNILIPMEFLSIPEGQTLNGKAPESCTREMVKQSATSTDERKRRIMELLQFINHEGIATIASFGIKIRKDFIQVLSHILNPPELLYKAVGPNNPVVHISKPGEWRLMNEQFLIPCHSKGGNDSIKWGILVLEVGTAMHRVNEFGVNIVKMARQMGVKLEDYNSYNVEINSTLNDLDDTFKSFLNDNFKLLFVIISKDPKHGDAQRSSVKQSSELCVGIMTQCIVSSTIDSQRNRPSTLQNIMLKVNEKLGGTNHRIADSSTVNSLKPNIMVIGADVTHPSPDQSKIPSVAGIVASYDQFCVRYRSTIQIQLPKEEIIQNFEEIVTSSLQYYQSKNKRFPEHILYYRDGVSEGQFKKVEESELRAIKAACNRMNVPGIKITVIIVQKRHHTRFFPKKAGDQKFNNVIPGTVVDSEIVDSNRLWQFFMVSHIAIQGVARPTKYVIIYDDSGISNKDLQEFTFNLCHLYARCNRSVSYVAPTYYAHLLAARGKDYIKGKKIDFGNLKAENEKLQVKLSQEKFFI